MVSLVAAGPVARIFFDPHEIGLPILIEPGISKEIDRGMRFVFLRGGGRILLCLKVFSGCNLV